jgi:hypothetical protein
MSESPNTPLTDGKKQDVSPGSGSGATSRRRLLTGSAALPVVMTLPTNASAAAFGSSLRCLNNQTDQPDSYFAMAPDGWKTEQVACIRVSLTNGNDPCDVGDYGGGKYYDRNGRKWYPAGDRFVPEGYGDGPGYVVKSYTTAYTYVYVGEDGTYWGIDPTYRSRGGLAVYGSCYASIMGTPA